MAEETKIKQIKNLFNSLIKDERTSVFYAANQLNKEKKRKLVQETRLQTDQEFQQSKIKKS